MAASARAYKTRRKANPHGSEKGRRKCSACSTWRYADAYSWSKKTCDACTEKRASDLRKLWAVRMKATKAPEARKSPADVGPAPDITATHAKARSRGDARRAKARERMRRNRAAKKVATK